MTDMTIFRLVTPGDSEAEVIDGEEVPSATLAIGGGA
jgi:hypothetical protein